MFEFKNKEKLKAGDLVSEPPTHEKKHSFSVHTMPMKFHTAASQHAAGGFSTPDPKDKKTGKIVIIVVSAVVVLGLGVVGYLWYQNSNKDAANANANLNENTNESLLNIIINRNKNTNANLNANANANSNANTNANSNANTNAAVLIPLAQIPSSQDLDADLLTDTEEIDFTTQKSDNDSDDDTFSDGTEIRLGYSPLGSGKLEGSTIVDLYQNTVYGFSFLYPKNWNVQRRGENQGVILLSPAGTEYIDVSVQDNVARLTPDAWYKTNNPSFQGTLETITSWDKKVTGVKSPDGYSVHFGSGNYIFTFYYNLQGKTQADYKMTFDMITSSIGLLPISSLTNENTNTNVNVNSNTNSNSNTNINTNTNTNANANTNTNTNSNTNS